MEQLEKGKQSCQCASVAFAPLLNQSFFNHSFVEFIYRLNSFLRYKHIESKRGRDQRLKPTLLCWDSSRGSTMFSTMNEHLLIAQHLFSRPFFIFKFFFPKAPPSLNRILSKASAFESPPPKKRGFVNVKRKKKRLAINDDKIQRNALTV